MRAHRWALVPAALLVLAGPLGCTSAGPATAPAAAAGAATAVGDAPAGAADVPAGAANVPAAAADARAAAGDAPVGEGPAAASAGSAEALPARPVVAPRGTGPAPGVAEPPVVAPRGAGLPPGVADPPAGNAGLPPGVADPPAGTTQLVTVLAPGAASTTATLRSWQREADGTWRAVRGPVRVRVGTDGVGRASERTRRTPAGTFTLAQAFGRAADPGSRLPYRRVGNQDWWVSDPRSPAYNTYRHCAPGSCPFNESAGENLGRSGPSYDHALVIGYNTTRPVAGAGSAFFLHVDAGVPSAGCVVTPRAEVVALLRWLDPARHPRITIGTG